MVLLLGMNGHWEVSCLVGASWVSLPLWGSPECGLGLCCKEVADAEGGFHREPSPVLIHPVVRWCHQKVHPVQCGGW